MTELKKLIEALLFSAGKAVDIVEISRLCREPDFSIIMLALEELRQEYEEKQGSLMIVRDGDLWKMVPREQYLAVVRKIVTKTELNKTIVETLATVAAKAPVLQSQIIKIRTNKAYDHLAALEDMGYITREKKGRTKLIKLTPKFFDYFDVPEGKVREKFARVDELEQQIMNKENTLTRAKENFEQRKEEHKMSEDEMKKQAEEEGKRLDSEIGNLEEQIPPELLNEETKVEPYAETLGELEVFDEGKGGAKKEKQLKEFKPKPKKEKIDWEKPKEEKPKEAKEKKTVEEKKPELQKEKNEWEKLKQEKIVKPTEQKPKEAAPEPEGEKIEAPKEKTAEEIEADKQAEQALLEKQAASKGVFAEGMTPEIEQKVDEEVEAMTGVKKAAEKAEAAELEETGEEFEAREEGNADWQEEGRGEGP
jgi:segregation and condensation protein B